MEVLGNYIKQTPTQEFLKEIHVSGTLIECKIDTPLFYEGQTPIVVYYLISGIIEIGQGKKTLDQATSGQVVGLEQFYEHKPSLYWALAKKGTKIYYLDKSGLKDILDKGTSLVS